MLPSFRPGVMALALFLSALAALPFFFRERVQTGLYFFEISVASDSPGMISIYYDVGRRFSESDAFHQPLVPGKQARVYRFPLPSGTYHGLRVDPINTDRVVMCSDAKIVRTEGRTIRTFLPNEFGASNGIDRLVINGGVLEVHPTRGTNDPFCVLALKAPIELPADFAPWTRLLGALPAFAAVFLAVCLIASAAAGNLPLLARFRASPEPAPPASGFSRVWQGEVPILTTMGLLIVFKFWLTSVQPIYALGGAGHDDQLFINLAHTLAEGRWLGDYSQFTLMKGPMYSIVMAATYKLGLPFFTILHFLYSAGCLLVVVALRPLAASRAFRLTLFTVLLFNPVTFETVVNSRILRQNFLPCLTLLIVAGFIGLHTRRFAAKRQLALWAVLTGVALPTFWLTREESVWLLPCIACLWIVPIVAVVRRRSPDRTTRLLLLALPAVFLGLGIGTVAYLNFRYYGVFTTCEFKHRDFKDAFGALLRIEPEPAIPYVATPRATREQLYALSPAFAELRSHLDGPDSEGWASASQGLTGIPPSEREIATGWFMWAVRDAVAVAGHCRSGRDAMAFYARMAREINDACNRGAIKAGPPRSGFVPPFHAGLVTPLVREVLKVSDYFFSFAEMYTTPQFSLGDTSQLADFARLTHGTLARRHSDPPRSPLPYENFRLSTLARISTFYQAALPWLGGAAFLAFLGAVCVATARRRLSYFTWVCTGLIGSVMALVAAISLIQVTSFPAINTGYFSGSYGLWLLFTSLAWLALHETLRQPTNR